MSNTGILRYTSLIVLIIVLSLPQLKAQPVNTWAHDPVMIESEGTYYLFHTGRGIYFQTSTDRVNWERGGGTLIAKETDDWPAVGHPAAYTFNGTDYLVAHAYDKDEKGRPKLIFAEISRDEDG